MKKIIIMLLTVPLLLISCKKEDVLPAATSEGKNTFGCYVNGKLWLPKGTFNVPGTSANYDLGLFLTISAANKKNDSGFSFILKEPMLLNQTYDLSDTSIVKTYYQYKSQNFIYPCIYEDFHVIEGKLLISNLNLKERILSGTFEFTTYNPECGDTIKVTDGRFDIGEITY